MKHPRPPTQPSGAVCNRLDAETPPVRLLCELVCTVWGFAIASTTPCRGPDTELTSCSLAPVLRYLSMGVFGTAVRPTAPGQRQIPPGGVKRLKQIAVATRTQTANYAILAGKC